MRRSRRSSRVAPAPVSASTSTPTPALASTSVALEKSANKNKPSDRSPRQYRSPFVRAGTASTPVSTKVSESPPIFDNESPIRRSLSPIPFHCTQDGVRGENYVIWDYDSPSSKKSVIRNVDTSWRPRNGKIFVDNSPVSRISTKKKQLRMNLVQKNFLDAMNEELAALKEARLLSNFKCNSKNESDVTNENINPCISKPPDNDSYIIDNTVVNNVNENPEDPTINLPNDFDVSIFAARRNDPLSESDNSLNELLIEASQKVENKIQNERNVRSSLKHKRNSPLPNIIENVAIEKYSSPARERKVENSVSNDTFDNLLMDVNESLIDGLNKNSNINENNNVNIKVSGSSNSISQNTFVRSKNASNISDLFSNSNNKSISNNSLNASLSFTKNSLNDSRSKLSRHSSMPMSTYANNDKRPKYSGGISLSRHNSMPSQKECENSQTMSKCSAEEIKRKHQAAREKLLAKKREVVRSDSTKSSPLISSSININNIRNIRLSSSFKQNKTSDSVYQNLFNESSFKSINQNIPSVQTNKKENCVKNINIHEEIERKRREAIERLQKKRLRGDHPRDRLI